MTTAVTVAWLSLPGDAEEVIAREGFVVTGAERTRADTYRRAVDRARSLLAAGLLRAVVAEHAGVRPAEVGVDRACHTCGRQHGRPVVALPALLPPHVSVTHSGSWVGVAVSPGGPVGLDVEVRAAAASAPLHTVAAESERPGLRAAEDPGEALARLWVAKEAALKAAGHGLAVAPAHVVLSSDGTRVRRWPLADDPERTVIHCVDPDATHAGAVCVLDGRGSTVHPVRWDQRR